MHLVLCDLIKWLLLVECVLGGGGGVCEVPEVVLDAFHSWGRLGVEGTGTFWLHT